MRAGKNFFRLRYYDEGTGTIREGQFYRVTVVQPFDAYTRYLLKAVDI